MKAKNITPVCAHLSVNFLVRPGEIAEISQADFDEFEGFFEWVDEPVAKRAKATKASKED
jgi:hypothetical protein